MRIVCFWKKRIDRAYIALEYFSSLAFRMMFVTPTELSSQILAALMYSFKALQLAKAKLCL